jgi:hypothetical protein
MNKPEKVIARTVAFLISAAITASTFALLSSWAWTQRSDRNKQRSQL